MSNGQIVTAFTGIKLAIGLVAGGIGIGGVTTGGLFFSRLSEHDANFELLEARVVRAERQILANTYRQDNMICLLRHLAGTGDRSPQQCQDDFDRQIQRLLQGGN